MTTQTRLAQHIQKTPLCDTHEHLWSEQEFIRQAPDILQTLFSAAYATADLVVAGALTWTMRRRLSIVPIRISLLGFGKSNWPGRPSSTPATAKPSASPPSNFMTSTN